MATERIRIEMLGGLRVVHDGTVIDHFVTRNTGALLARLAFLPDRAHSREELACLLWPEADDETARHNLRQTLLYLRRAIDSAVPHKDYVVADKAAVRLLATAMTTDISEFESALRSAANETGPARVQLLKEAADLYSGELLASYYDEWIFAERRRLEAAYLAALDELQKLLADAGELTRAAEYALKVAVLDPYREEAHVAVMRLFAAAGQPGAVRKQFEEMERILRDDLDAEPSADVRAEAERLTAYAASNASPTESLSLVASRPAAITRARSLPVALAAGVIYAAVIMPAWLWSHPRAGHPPQSATVGKTDSADARFQTLEDLREHGFQTGTPTQRDAARKRHAERCLSLAEEAWTAWYGREEDRWVKRLEANHDDFRTALRWFLEHEPNEAIQMSGALTRFWYLRSHTREGHRWLRDALAAARQERTAFRARALVGYAFLSGDHGQSAESQCNEALSIYRERGDRWGQAHALRHLGFLASEKQRTAEPMRLYEQALSLFREVGDERGQAVTLLCMGFLSQPDRDHKTSLAMSDDHMTRSLALFRKVGNGWGVSMALGQLGANAARRQQTERAETLLTEARRADPYTAVPSVREVLDQWWSAMLRGDVRTVRRCRIKALEMARDSGDKVTLAWVLDWAVTGSDDWDPVRRARLRAASLAFDRSLGVRQSKFDLDLRRREVAKLRSTLGNEQFEAAFRAGARLTVELAVEEALSTR